MRTGDVEPGLVEVGPLNVDQGATTWRLPNEVIPQVSRGVIASRLADRR